MRYVFVGALVALALCGCWNAQDQYRTYMEEGRSRAVPLIIYDISANDPHYLYPQTFAVGIVNTEEQDINSVKLTVAVCGIKAEALYPGTIDLGGPFEAHTSSVVSVLSKPDKDGKQYRLVFSHVLITSVSVTDASGTKTFQGKQVDALLDPKIANFCAADII
jgi:hypothetical protein